MSEGLRCAIRLERKGFNLRADFELPARGVTALLGPSGCGKTSLLRCIAGLESGFTGRIAFEGSIWNDGGESGAAAPQLAPHLRPCGLVFQDARLFPHLTVRRNLEFGMRRATGDAAIRFDHAVEVLMLGGLIDRMPATLSAGQAQRVAIARALLAAPRLLLMDEPLANLDVAARAEVLDLLDSLVRELSLPILYVTHQVAEAVRLADHLILMDAGEIVAQGPLVEVLARNDLPGAHFDDAGAVLETTVAAHDETHHLTELSFAGGRILVPRQPLSVGDRLRVRIPARDVSLALDRPQRTSILNVIPARIESLADDGPSSLLARLDCGGCALLARVTRRSAADLGLAPGTEVFAQIKSVALTR